MTEAQIISLKCPSCGASVTTQPGSNHFTCAYCGNAAVIQVNVQPVTAPPAPAAIRPLAPRPQSVEIIQDARGARLIQRWFSLKYIPMAFFAFAWDAFLIFWYSMALGSGAPWIFVVFPIVHVAVGVGVTYSTLAGFINRTTVELTPDELAVYFDPLPWLGEKRIKTGQIKQLYCQQSVKSSKNGSSYTYHLVAVTQDDRQVKLIDNLDTPDVAQFFEQQLETWLHIRDVPVLGEYERG